MAVKKLNVKPFSNTNIINTTYVVNTEQELIDAMTEIESADIITKAWVDVQANITTSADYINITHKDKSNLRIYSSNDSELTI